MKTLIMTIASLGLAGTVYAATPVQTEYFYQADTGNNVLSPSLDYNSSSTELSGSKTDTTGQTLGLAFERGINEMYSFGASVAYMTSTAEQSNVDTDTKGLGDLNLFAKGRYAFVEGSSMHYGANLMFSPGDQVIDKDGEFNGYSGRNTLVPYIGYQWILGGNAAGIRLKTDFALSKKKVENKITSKTTEQDGLETTELAAFYEIPYDMGSVGFFTSYSFTTESKSEGVLVDGGQNDVALGVYSPYRFSENASVIGNLTWGKIASSSIKGADVDSSSDLSVSVSGRFNF